jgi:flagellar motor switch protein FliN
MATEETGAAEPPTPEEGGADWAEALLEQKSGTDQSGGVLSGDSARPFSGGADSPGRDINMVLDIPVQLSVELGRTKVSIKHILQLGQGSVVELDALAGEPMDVLVNGYLIAQGEVVVVNDKFGIRLTDVVTPSERLRRINKG